MTPAELLAQWRACIADDRANGRWMQAQVRSEDADALELALADTTTPELELAQSLHYDKLKYPHETPAEYLYKVNQMLFGDKQEPEAAESDTKE